MSSKMTEAAVLEKLSEYSAHTDMLLKMYFPNPRTTTDALGARVSEAMGYSLFAGGKRLRPALLLASYELFGGQGASAAPLSAAVEMIHTYSLIHDDLPCMDDDELRRGKPSCHVVYGYATALLAGDALLNLAYETIMKGYAAAENKENYMRAAGMLAQAAGIMGMVGGQALDVISDTLPPTRENLSAIQRGKTSALITACVCAGAAAAGANETELDLMRSYGEAIGEMFQIVDDVLDVISTSEELGKNVHMDDANGTLTYPALFGLAGAYRRISELSNAAAAALSLFDERAKFLNAMAEYLAHRTK